MCILRSPCYSSFQNWPFKSESIRCGKTLYNNFMITYASQYNIWFLKIYIILLNVVTLFIAFWNRLYLHRAKMASTFDNVQVAVLTENYNFKFLTDHPVVLDVSHQGDCVMMQFFKGIYISLFLIILWNGFLHIGGQRPWRQTHEHDEWMIELIKMSVIDIPFIIYKVIYFVTF